MLGLWSAAVYHAAEDADYDLNAADRPEEEDRNRKRQRRSIFFAQPDSDSSDDGEDYGDANHRRSYDCLNGKIDAVQATTAVVPSTPYAADPLSRGACLLTPSFPRRSSSPCLESTSKFVAVHEEPNSGFRHYMEDRSAAMTTGGVAYLGIYDGHGGVDASTFLQRHLLATIQTHLQPGCDVHDALTEAYMKTNAAFRATGSIQGSTATTVILKHRRLIAANVGDSPAFVVKKSGEVYSIIQEHKIEGEEAARIAAQGVPIYRSPTGPAYMGTPDGTRWLNMSRAFGDFVYPAISCEPHVCSLDVSDGKFLVMGSDGLTEKWPVAEAAQYVTQLASAGWSLPAICRSLVERSLARGSTDNISCMIVDLEAYMLHAEAAASPMERDEAFVDAASGAVADDFTQQQEQQAGDAVAAPESLRACRWGGQQPQWVLAGDQEELGLRCEEYDGTEESGSLQRLLCNERSSVDEGPRSGGVARCRLAHEACVVVSGVALASCVADAIGVSASAAAAPESARRHHADFQVCADGIATTEPAVCAPAAEACFSVAEALGDASPACSSPDVCEKQQRLGEEIAEGNRQATPQPAPTACRVPTPIGGETAAAVWAEGDGLDARAA